MKVGPHFQTIRHEYAHARVELHVFEAATHPTDAEPAEVTGFVWVELNEVLALRFPEANAPLLAELARRFG